MLQPSKPPPDSPDDAALTASLGSSAKGKVEESLRNFGREPPRRAGSALLRPISPFSRTWLATSRWLDVYGTFLFALILLYFGLIFLAAFNAVNGIYFLLWQEMFDLSPGVRWSIGGVLAVLLVQLCWRIWRDLPGLVTTVYDPIQHEISGFRLESEAYPDLYQAVASVGKLIGAPLPHAIWITHPAACYVTEERHFSISTRRKLNLVLGMPQFTVLTVTELKVILAHELAHFALGETRLRVFNFRFVESLKAALADMHVPWLWCVNPVYGFCALYVRLFVRLTAPVERQQELRADAISAEAFGGELAMHTLLKNWQVERQFEELLDHISEHPRDPDLANRSHNIYRWFANHWMELSAGGYQLLMLRLAEEERPSIMDSHPTIQERIRVMAAYPPQDQPEPQAAHQLLHNLSDLEDRLDAEIRRA